MTRVVIEAASKTLDIVVIMFIFLSLLRGRQDKLPIPTAARAHPLRCSLGQRPLWASSLVRASRLHPWRSSLYVSYPTIPSVLLMKTIMHTHGFCSPFFDQHQPKIGITCTRKIDGACAYSNTPRILAHKIYQRGNVADVIKWCGATALLSFQTAGNTPQTDWRAVRA